MGDTVQIFKNEEFGEVRGILINDEPYFVGKDVAKILGYSNTRKTLIDHVDEEDKLLNDGVTIRDSMGREQNPVVINESGLYSLILSSKLPNAKRFKRWVTSEVLPQIRKTGAYVSNEQPKKLSAMDQLRLQYEVLEQHEERFTKIEKKIDSLELNPSQRKQIQNARHKKVAELLGGKKSKAYKDNSFRGRVYSDLGRAFNNYFDVPAYDCTPRNKFKEALEVIDSYNLNTQLNMELKYINNQPAMEEVACTKE